MQLLRRAALRALSARPSPSPLLSSCTRSFVTSSSQTLRPQQQWCVSRFQKRFASDEVKSPSEAEEQAAAEVSSTAETSTPTAESEAVVDAVISSQQPSTEAEVPESDSAEATQSATTSFSAPIASSTGAAAAGAAAGFAASQGQSPAFGGATQRAPAGNVVYVGNLFFEVTEQELKEFFGRLGAVEQVKIIYDPRGLSKGFGFITFQNRADAERAIETLNNEVFQGRRLTVQFHRAREPRTTTRSPRDPNAPRRINPPSKTLFIGNMSFEMSDKDLNDLFRDVRNVLDVRVAIDRRSGQPRGFAHADFIDIPSAMKAKEQLEGKEVYGRSLRVDFTQSTPSTGPPRSEGFN